MFLRIARFEGGEAGALDDQIEAIRRRMTEGRERMASGELGGDEGEAMQALSRVMVAVNRENGATASLTFAESDEDIRKVDAWMNNMSPGPGGGQRTSVEIYEVAIDEQRD